MELELDCDFYFGDIDDGLLKKVDFSVFDKHISLLKTVKLFSNFNWIRGAFKLTFCKRYKTYILTGDPFCLSNWLILIANKILGKKTYLWTHGWYGDETRIKQLLKKIFFGLSTGLFLYGDYAKDLMIQNGFRKEKLHVIYNSLNYDSQIVVRNKLRQNFVYQDYFGNDYPVVIFTGRLTSIKKIDQLIETHHILLKQGVFFNVFLLGDGPEFAYLKNLVDKNGNSSYFWFYGACYDEAEIGNFYYNASVCVSPGNVGLTAIHAMTYGCPVITHNNFPQQMPEFEVIQENITGTFFEKDNVNSLAEVLKKWITIVKDKASIERDCFNVIDSKYNPNHQIKVFKEFLR